MNKFTLGAIAGMTSLAVAFPIVAQVVGAQSTSSAPSSPSMMERMFTKGAPTQAQVQEMITHTDTMLKNIDAITAATKTSLQAHKTALTAAAAITDETQRGEAVKKAHDDMRTSMQKTMTDLGMDGKFMMGFGGPGHMGGKMKMRGEMKGMFAEKLGMTEVELKAAIDSGKSIEDIAKEKGIELPARPEGGMFFKHMKGPMMKEANDMMAPAVTETAPN